MCNRIIVGLFVLVVMASMSQRVQSQALEELESVLDKEAAGEPAPAERTTPAPSPARPAAPKPDIVADPPPGYLGLYAIEVDGRLIVETVHPSSPAAAAGLRAGDQILRIGGAPLTSLDEMSQVLESLPAGTRLSFLVKRLGRDTPLIATFGQRAVPARVVEKSPTPQPTPAVEPSGDSLEALGELERLLGDAPPPEAIADDAPVAGDPAVAKRVESLEGELRSLNARIEQLERTLSRFSATDE